MFAVLTDSREHAALDGSGLVKRLADGPDRLTDGAVHQGLALKIDEPESLSIAELAASGEGFLVMLDQITDPQNIGAIFRSAAAFGAKGVILQDRHAPALT